jgi:hypothetical protein
MLLYIFITSSRCTALCAIGIFIVEELTYNKGHGRIHVYTSLLLTSIMVSITRLGWFFKKTDIKSQYFLSASSRHSKPRFITSLSANEITWDRPVLILSRMA